MSIGRVWERVAAICRLAQLTVNADESGNVQRMQLQFNALETRDKIPSAQFYGFASSPLPGCNAIVVNPSGDAGGGVVLATHDPRYRPTGMGAGEVKIYDNHGQSIHLASDGTIHLTGQHTFTVVADTTVNVTAPTVNVNASSGANVTSPIITLTGEVRVVGELKKNGIVVIAP